MIAKLIFYLVVLTNVFIHIQAAVSTGNETWVHYEEEPHAFAANMWWRLANYTAKSEGKTGDCYVCTKMPHSASGPHVEVKSPRTEEELECPIFVSITGMMAPNRSAIWSCGKSRIMMLATQVHAKVTTIGSIPDSLLCMERETGTVRLGIIPKSKCNRTYHHCEIENMSCCMSCILHYPKANMTECSKRTPHPISTMIAYGWANPFIQDVCSKYCALVPGQNCYRYAPASRGTRAVKDWFWLCGHRVYTTLPEDWSGRCALVTLEEYSMVIRPHKPHVMTKQKQKKKRSLSGRGSTSSLSRDNPVPKQHRLWTGTERFFEAVFPGIGVSSLQIEVEVTRYELISFINTTRDTLAGVQQELRGLRLTALQNRLVLDQLTAAGGGVCVIVGTSCCTYIPENDADGHLISEGLKNMTRIAQELQEREVTDNQSGFLAWLTGWQQMLVSALIPIGVILLIMAFIICCIIPFIRALINRAMNNFVSSQYALMNRTVKC